MMASYLGSYFFFLVEEVRVYIGVFIELFLSQLCICSI